MCLFLKDKIGKLGLNFLLVVVVDALGVDWLVTCFIEKHAIVVSLLAWVVFCIKFSCTDALVIYSVAETHYEAAYPSNYLT